MSLIALIKLLIYEFNPFFNIYFQQTNTAFRNEHFINKQQ